MNRGAIKTQMSRFAGDPDQTRFSGQYDTALDRAQEQFCLDSRALFKDVSWSHSADDANEDLPSDFMWEDRATYDGLKIDPISRAELNRLNPSSDWTAHTGTTPSHYIIDPEEAVKRIVLYPIPSKAATLAMRYYPLPASSTTDSDTPLNSSALLAQFHPALAAYGAWLILMGEQSTNEVIAKKKELLAIYNDAVAKAVDTFGNTVSAGWQIRPIR